LSHRLLIRAVVPAARFPEPLVLVDWTAAGAVAAGSEEVLHYIRDALGSVVGLLDAGQPDATPEPVPARLVERYDYDPYGKTYITHWDPAAGSGSGDWIRHTADQPSAFGNPFMWTGQRQDVAIGLYHFPFRTYSPRLGRWLQRDPLGYVDGVNLYEYVRGRPTHFFDDVGMAAMLPGDGDIASTAYGALTSTEHDVFGLLQKPGDDKPMTEEEMDRYVEKLRKKEPWWRRNGCGFQQMQQAQPRVALKPRKLESRYVVREPKQKQPKSEPTTQPAEEVEDKPLTLEGIRHWRDSEENISTAEWEKIRALIDLGCAIMNRSSPGSWSYCQYTAQACIATAIKKAEAYACILQAWGLSAPPDTTPSLPRAAERSLCG